MLSETRLMDERTACRAEWLHEPDQTYAVKNVTEGSDGLPLYVPSRAGRTRGPGLRSRRRSKNMLPMVVSILKEDGDHLQRLKKAEVDLKVQQMRLKKLLRWEITNREK
jgi:hypothetical protein